MIGISDFWAFGRAIIWLKRISLAADRIASAQEDQARIARQEFSLAHPSRRPVRHAEFGVADVEEDWNKRYEIEREGGGES